MLTCSRVELQRNVLRQQCLSAPAESVEEAVTQMLGCRGAEGSTPYLSLMWRVKGFQPAQFDRAVHQDRSLLRVRGPRGTFFWVTPALAPVFLAAAREMPLEVYLSKWGIEEGEYRAIEEEVALAVASNPLGVSELKKRIPTPLQRPVQRKGAPPSTSLLVSLDAMQLEGRVTLLKEPGFDRHRSREYYGDTRDTTRPNLVGLVAELYPTIQLPHGEVAELRRSLVRAYVQAYGPVTVEDIAWWTGWTKREVRGHLQSLSAELTDVQVLGLSGSFLIHTDTWNSVSGVPSGEATQAHLLPGGDSLMKGYEGFGRFLTRSSDDHNVLRFMPAALVDGLGHGNWGYRMGPETLEVVVERFEPPQESMIRSLTEAANRVATFLCDGEPGTTEVRFRSRTGRWNPRDPFPDGTRSGCG